MPTSSGTVAEWSYGRIAVDRVLGWAALYWDGSGGVNTADLYTSIPVNWAGAIHTPDPNDLPLDDLQIYLLFWRRNSSMFCEWMDGWDEFWLWGKDDMVLGTMLSDNKWSQVQSRARNVIYDHRGQFKQGITDWINSVPE
jgi:hypothetical protein